MLGFYLIFFLYWLDIAALSVVMQICSTYTEEIIGAGLVVKQGISF